MVLLKGLSGFLSWLQSYLTSCVAIGKILRSMKLYLQKKGSIKSQLNFLSLLMQQDTAV